MEPRWVDSADGLSAVVHELGRHDRFALDTEFHGERSYWPRLALVQVAWADGIGLIDPLAVDPAPLAAALDGSGTMVAHAADQDLGILLRACGCVPNRLFDTQVAAGFLGLGSPSLAALAERLLGVKLAKGDRLTDWTRRPLQPAQRAYAAADVEYLLAMHDELVKRLTDLGRLDWALDECEERRTRVRTRPDIETAWWRIKGARQLRGKARTVAQAVAGWRERTAQSIDVPPRFVLSDLALAGIVQRPPNTRDELLSIRGIDGRMRDGNAQQLLDAVASGLEMPTSELRMPESDHVDRSLAPAVTILSAWLAGRASELSLEPSLLGTRADLMELVRGRPSRLDVGWRHDFVGEPLRRLLAGEASIALLDRGRRIELREGVGDASIARPD